MLLSRSFFLVFLIVLSFSYARVYRNMRRINCGTARNSDLIATLFLNFFIICLTDRLQRIYILLQYDNMNTYYI